MFSGTFAENLIKDSGMAIYLLVSLSLLVVVPAVILFLVILLVINQKRRSRYGLGIGLGIATWARLCYVCVPYLGFYPNLIGALIGILLLGPGALNSWEGELCVHITNFLLWPLLGWIAFGLWQASHKYSVARKQTQDERKQLERPE